MQRNFEAIQQRFPLGPDDLHFGGTVSALPTGVDEGFEVNYIADSTNGVVWRFKYLPTTSGTYPWLFIGGPPLFSEVATTQSTSSTSYAALTTAGPSVTLPLAGDYDVAIGCRCYTNGNSRSLSMSYDIGATGAVDADRMDYYVAGNTYDGLATLAPHISRERRKTGLTAVALTAKYKTSGGTADFGSRWMRVLPVRVS